MTESQDAVAIDWDLSIQLAGGNEALARDLLEMLKQSLPKDKAAIDEAYQKQAWENVLHHVHKLHGAACYCGVPKLKEAAHGFETALKRELVGEYDSLWGALQAAIDAVGGA